MLRRHQLSSHDGADRWQAPHSATGCRIALDAAAFASLDIATPAEVVEQPGHGGHSAAGPAAASQRRCIGHELQAHKRSRRLQQAAKCDITGLAIPMAAALGAAAAAIANAADSTRGLYHTANSLAEVPAVAAANSGTVREAAAASLELHGLFGSGMVLSRSGRIFGTAMPGAAISVRLLSSTTTVAGHRQAAAAAAAAAATSAVASGGAWSANRTMRGGGPYELQVSATPEGGGGTASTTLSDVYVGDVYLLSGQSNANVSLSYLANY